MSEVNKQKWARMRLILARLEERPMTFEQIHALVYGGTATQIGKRTTQNYLAELCALDIAYYDAHAQFYELAGNKKQVYETKHNYEIALKHSKRLVLSSRYNQRFDQMRPTLALDVLVFEPERDIDSQCVKQHLRTGYSRDVYALMEKYKQLMDEAGLSRIPSIPKFSLGRSTWIERSNMDEAEGNISEQDFEKKMLFEDIQMKGDKIKICASPLGARQPEYVHIAKKRLLEIIDLRDLLVGRIYAIVNDVINGSPLKGTCQHCPTQKVFIRR